MTHIAMRVCGKDTYVARDTMRSDIELINDWLQQNQLILNWGKTKAMLFPFYNRDQTNPLTLPTNLSVSR